MARVGVRVGGGCVEERSCAGACWGGENISTNIREEATCHATVHGCFGGLEVYGKEYHGYWIWDIWILG